MNLRDPLTQNTLHECSHALVYRLTNTPYRGIVTTNSPQLVAGNGVMVDDYTRAVTSMAGPAAELRMWAELRDEWDPAHLWGLLLERHAEATTDPEDTDDDFNHAGPLALPLAPMALSMVWTGWAHIEDAARMVQRHGGAATARQLSDVLPSGFHGPQMLHETNRWLTVSQSRA